LNRVRLGRSGLEVSRLGIGAWRLAGGEIMTERPAGHAETAVATIRRGLDQGMNWIDTSAAYGYGESERLIGKALAGLAERPYVITKCGWLWDEQGTFSQSLRAEEVRRSLEKSLERLGMDEVDLFLIHWPVPDEEIEEGWSTLAELKREGKTRHIGVSNFDVDQLRRCEAIAPVEVVQPPFSLADPAAAQELLPCCSENDIGVIVYSPQASGILTGAMTRESVDALPQEDVRRRLPPYQEPALSRNLALVDRLRELGAPRGLSPGALAIAWTLAQPGVTGAIVGVRLPEHVDDAVGAADPDLAGVLAAAGIEPTG
jgi:aryl-alcohol dehydrogenase-like predicted oxidoreductase